MRFTGHTQPQKARPRTSPYTTTTSRAPVSADAASKPRDAAIASKAPNGSNNGTPATLEEDRLPKNTPAAGVATSPSPPANSPASPHPAKSGGKQNSPNMQTCTPRRTSVIFPMDRVTIFSSTMAMCRGNTGCSDRASSAANETAQWAVSQSEDCLSESGYPVAPPTGESQQDSREPQFAHVQADGTLPHFVPERRLRLFNSLKALGTPAAPTVTTRLWGQVTIDTELCRSCRMCTVFCPTGALTRFDAANDAFGVEHRSALCMQCRLCETICPEQAITVAEEVSADEFLSGKKFRFTMQPIGWNPGAEDSIASRMARFIKVDNLQEPQAKVKSFDTAARREYAQAREARRREIREQHSS